MKYIFSVLLLTLFLGMGQAQKDVKWPTIDPSVMDMEYFPSRVAYRNYLSDDERNLSPKIRIEYSRPLKKGRKIFGELVPYGEIWRMGANEANEITFYQDVEIGGKAVIAGTYTVFAKVADDAWTLYFSDQKGMWGSKGFDPSMIKASATIPSQFVEESQEMLSIAFQEIDPMTVHMIVQWDKTQVQLPIKFNPIVFSDADKSPMDRVQYPGKSAYTNYLDAGEKKVDPQIRVTYSRPYKNGRDVFVDLVKPGSMWRIGANQSTEVVFYEDVMVGDEKLRRGKYVVFGDVKEGSWDIIFSKDYPSWGYANRDESKDVARVNIPVTNDTEVLENLTIIFEKKSDKLVHMVIGWDKTRAALPIKFEK